MISLRVCACDLGNQGLVFSHIFHYMPFPIQTFVDDPEILPVNVHVLQIFPNNTLIM